MRLKKMLAVEQIYYIYEQSKKNEKLVIFIHGYNGNYISTWGNLQIMLLKRQLGKTIPFDDWDYIFLGYNTSSIESYIDIACILNDKYEEAINGNSIFERKYNKIVLCGHSLGTLGIRQLLCAECLHKVKIANTLKSILLFGSPIEGSILAKFSFKKIAKALNIMNPQLLMLKQWCESIYNYTPWPKIKIYFGLRDWVVKHNSTFMINWKGDEKAVYPNLDHRKLVKPSAGNNFIIDKLSDELK